MAAVAEAVQDEALNNTDEDGEAMNEGDEGESRGDASSGCLTKESRAASLRDARQPSVGMRVKVKASRHSHVDPSLKNEAGVVTSIADDKAVILFGNKVGEHTLCLTDILEDPGDGSVLDEDAIMADLKIPKTQSLYTPSVTATGDNRVKTPSNSTNSQGNLEAAGAAAQEDGPAEANASTRSRLSSDAEEKGMTRKTSRADRFREANGLTLRRRMNAEPVAFKDGKSGNKLVFKGLQGAAGGMSYRVNGEERPDVHTMMYDERGPVLRFVDIGRGCNLPTENLQETIKALRRLADDCGVWHNLPKPKVNPVPCVLRSGETVTMTYEKGRVLTILQKGGKRVGVTRDLRFDVERCTLYNNKGDTWKLTRESAHETVNNLIHLCDECSVPHQLTRVKKKGKIWIKPMTRIGLKVIAVAEGRKSGKILSVDLMKELTRWCGMYDVDSLHVSVVLWGYSDVMESRHVRIPRGIHATPVDVHRKLSEDKRWLAARGADFKWDAQAFYWFGDADTTTPGFLPQRLLPTFPLVTQGYCEASGEALHIIATTDRKTLDFFKAKCKTNKTSPADHSVQLSKQNSFQREFEREHSKKGQQKKENNKENKIDSARNDDRDRNRDRARDRDNGREPARKRQQGPSGGAESRKAGRTQGAHQVPSRGEKKKDCVVQ